MTKGKRRVKPKNTGEKVLLNLCLKCDVHLACRWFHLLVFASHFGFSSHSSWFYFFILGTKGHVTVVLKSQSYKKRDTQKCTSSSSWLLPSPLFPPFSHLSIVALVSLLFFLCFICTNEQVHIYTFSISSSFFHGRTIATPLHYAFPFSHMTWLSVTLYQFIKNSKELLGPFFFLFLQLRSAQLCARTTLYSTTPMCGHLSCFRYFAITNKTMK